jgi:hypothetical protein
LNDLILCVRDDKISVTTRIVIFLNLGERAFACHEGFEILLGIYNAHKHDAAQKQGPLPKTGKILKGIPEPSAIVERSLE